MTLLSYTSELSIKHLFCLVIPDKTGRMTKFFLHLLHISGASLLKLLRICISVCGFTIQQLSLNAHISN